MKENAPLLKPQQLQPDEGATLWKYFTFQKYVSFLTNEAFHYARLDQLEDTLEGINQRYLSQLLFKDQLMKDPFIETNHRYFEQFYFGDKLKKAEEKFMSKQRSNFVLCWIESKRESAGLWNLYSEPGGVALKLKYSALLDTLRSDQAAFDYASEIASIEYGKVDYKNFVDPNEVRSVGFKVSNTAFRKDESFRHENEFRVSVNFTKLLPNNVRVIRQKITEAFMSSIQIRVHPKSTEWQIENIRKLTQALDKKLDVSNSELKLR